MELKDSEKLMLKMLADIHSHLGLQNSDIDSALVSRALYTGNTWALGQEYGDFLGFSDREMPPEVGEVYDLIDMWIFLEEGYEALNEDEKAELAKLALVTKGLKFPGFDGNNETRQLSIAKFIIQELGGFDHLKKRELNSHSMKLGSYRRMYPVFKKFRDNLDEGPLNVTELAEILNARKA